MDLGLIVPMLVRGDTGDYHDLIEAIPNREEIFQQRLESIVEHLSTVNYIIDEEIKTIPAKTDENVRGDK